jgi:thiosulfate reductase cytochrome b subunit
MKRHALATRIWHWVNLACLAILFMSGLNISNGHRRLYWGHWGFTPEHAWLEVPRFPGWMTIPDYYSLAAARDWHLLIAWPFAFGLLLFLVASIVNGHARKDLVTVRKEWRWSAIKSDIVEHLKFNFDHGGGKFNFLQKLAYGVVIFIMLPLMIFTGLAMSPGMDANWPFIIDLLGGRQSARSIHFILAWALVGFMVLHVVLVILSNPLKQLREMITGGKL